MPTVPEYPEEDWMLRLGRESGARQRFAAMLPKRAIPTSDIEESEKAMPLGAMAGPTQTQKSLKELTSEWAKKNVKAAEWAKKGVKPEFSKEEMAAGEWIQQNIKPSMHEIANKGVRNIYRIADEFAERHAVKGPREFQPVNWQALQNKYTGGAAIPTEKMEAARKLGYNPEYPIYKGGRRSEQEILERRTISDPSKKEFEKGQFFAEDPMVARHYKHSGGDVVEYVASPKKPAVVDLRGRHYDEDEMHGILEGARAKGHDLVVVKNIHDVGGGPQNQVVVIDPKIVRHPTAKFDPKLHHSINDLLATLLGVAGVGKVAKELSPDENK